MWPKMPLGVQGKSMHSLQNLQGLLKRFSLSENIACLQIGQAGGCAPLVGMLTSATALHSSVISFQMAVDHDEAQAHAATALAHLAALSSNQVSHILAKSPVSPRKEASKSASMRS